MFMVKYRLNLQKGVVNVCQKSPNSAFPTTHVAKKNNVMLGCEIFIYVITHGMLANLSQIKL